MKEHIQAAPIDRAAADQQAPITKGGGSANKTFLYQQTKALLNEESLTKFIRQHIFDLGTSACPPTSTPPWLPSPE